MSMYVSYSLDLLNSRPNGYVGQLDWDKSERGCKSLSIQLGPGPVVTHSPAWLECNSPGMEMESLQPMMARVSAVPWSECGWVLDRWYVRYSNGIDIISAEEIPARGSLDLTVWITPAPLGLVYWGATEVYPYFVYHGTGNLLATPAADALLGYGVGESKPKLIIDL